MGASWALGVHPDDAERVLIELGRGARRAPLVGGRVPAAHHHSGEYRWIDDRGVPRYVGGRFVGYVGTAIDIHERKTMEARLLEVYQREHRIAETLQRSLLPERLPPIEGLRAGGALPAGRARRRHRRRLVRRARAPRRARGARGRRRGRPRPARRRVDGPAPQRVPRLRDGRVLAGRGGGPHQPAGDERRGAGDGHGALPRARPRDRRGRRSAPPGHPPPLVLAPDGPRFLEGGRSVPIGAAEPAVFREATRDPAAGLLAACSTPTGWWSAATSRSTSASSKLAEAAGARRRRSRRALRARASAACWATREPGDDVALLAVRPLPVADTDDRA